MQVLDFGLHLAAVELGDLAAEDGCDLVRLSNHPVSIEKAFTQLVERGTPVEDEVVAEFDLSEEQPMLAAGVFSLGCREERREAGQPLLATAHQIAGCELVGKRLQAVRLGAF